MQQALGFMGEYRHALDPKNRLIIPSKFRELLGEQFVITRGSDRCLAVYPLDEWSRVQQSFPSQAIATADYRKFSRLLYAGAVTGEFDSQGRALIPAHLTEYAGIDRDVVIIGVGTRLEVWGADGWDAYRSEAEDAFGDVIERILESAPRDARGPIKATEGEAPK